MHTTAQDILGFRLYIRQARTSCDKAMCTKATCISDFTACDCFIYQSNVSIEMHMMNSMYPGGMDTL